MNLKLMKVSPKSFVLILSVINVIAGFILGAIVSVVSLLNPDDESSGLMVWAILIFPIVNGILAVLTGFFLTGLFNFLAKRFGGLELEFETSS